MKYRVTFTEAASVNGHKIDRSAPKAVVASNMLCLTEDYEPGRFIDAPLCTMSASRCDV